jgi:excisionase family DNA binding protein
MTEYHQPIAYSVNEACRVSSIGRTRLYELIKDGQLDVVKIGRRTLVKADSLLRLLNLDLPKI